MSSEVIFKDLQTIWLKLTRTGDLQYRTQQNQATFAVQVKTGVDLCWHTRQKFRDISSEKKDKLTSCKGSNEGKTSIKKQWAVNSKKRRNEADNSEKRNWRKKFKKAIQMQSGLSHVMSIVLEEETNNRSLVAALQPPLSPVPSKTPPILPPPILTPVPAISSADFWSACFRLTVSIHQGSIKLHTQFQVKFSDLFLIWYLILGER